ncbi:tetratricopeptide repeat protein 38-like [Gigantopelta aegis]|uniref:tetratricopeptide repeat protein 38-like n=1 Tax=Gigantopelta aegis TaxID=1735272 RepID=UPI001B889235|nr:tetratricopeptide repeat protein 38-like [Gigantopelta aegis]
MHCQWRGCEDWKNFGVPLSTTSNEASKAFDATLTQFVGLYNDVNTGGIKKSMTNMIQADPNFVMGHVLKNGLSVLGVSRTTRLDQCFANDLDRMVGLSKSPSVTEREKNHVKAVKLWADGFSDAACQVWEDILVDCPLDILALKFSYDSYIYLGYSNRLRDGPGRVLPFWKPTMPLYGYVIGLHAFGLEETNLLDRAEKAAKKALEINPRDAWATHSMCHVLETTGRQDDGIAFLTDTAKDWTTCGMLACHNYWHWSLYYIEKADYQNALNIYDNEVKIRSTNSGTLFGLIDSCSLLFRLEMEGVDVGDRWNKVFERCRPHIDDHILAFNDLHLLMGCLGAKQKDITAKMMESIEQFVREGKGTNQEVTRVVGQKLCESFVAYSDGDFAKAVDLLHPIRYNVIRIGGSHAQRDVFNLFLIQAAIKSPLKKHHKLARMLLLERKSVKESTPMTDRLIERVMALHAD